MQVRNNEEKQKVGENLNASGYARQSGNKGREAIFSLSQSKTILLSPFASQARQ